MSPRLPAESPFAIVTKSCFAPPLTPEGLYLQDKRRRDWDERERKIDREIAEARRRGVINEHWESTI